MVINAKRWVSCIILLLLICVAIYGICYAADRFYKTVYPKEYANFVEEYSQEFNIDENLVYAIIKTESGFKAGSTSNVGARGLTQIMEDTFNWIKTKLNDKTTTYDDMYSVGQNIRYGSFFIGYLKDEFNDTNTAVAAYHAGRSAVASWLKNPEYSRDGITLIKIPNKDTGHYVNKVIRSYRRYQKLY